MKYVEKEDKKLKYPIPLTCFLRPIRVKMGIYYHIIYHIPKYTN